LTMSDDGGLEELEESLRAAASCRCNWATTARSASNSARKASTSACNRWQLAHGGVMSVVMGAEATLLPAGNQNCERSRSLLLRVGEDVGQVLFNLLALGGPGRLELPDLGPAPLQQDLCTGRHLILGPGGGPILGLGRRRPLRGRLGTGAVLLAGRGW